MKSPRLSDLRILGRRCRAQAWVGVVVSCALGAGCTTLPPPRHLDLSGARIVPGTAAPALDVNGLPGGKAGGAAVGAGTGSGAGVVAGAVACLATGPFFPLCVVTVVPAGAAVGAVTGAVVGAVRTESSAAIELKTTALKGELAATSYQTLLAEQLRDRLRDDYSLAIPLESPSPEPTASVAADTRVVDAPLLLQVSVTEVGTEGKGEFALRLVTGLTLRRGPAVVVWRTSREVQSDTELTTDQWMASDAKALRGVLDACVRSAARRLATELGRGIEGSPTEGARLGGKYSTSCDDRPDDWQAKVAQP
jgi:hypothetical protein